MKKAIPFLLLVLSASGVYSSDSPGQVVKGYFEGYGNGQDTQELVGTYWLPSVMVYAAGLQPIQIPAAQFAGRLEAFRTQAREQGWSQGEIVELEECLLRSDMAMVSVRYRSQTPAGVESANAVLYTLILTDAWRISSVMPTDSGVLVGCDGTR